jgi:hypothetical protein
MTSHEVQREKPLRDREEIVLEDYNKNYVSFSHKLCN